MNKILLSMLSIVLSGWISIASAQSNLPQGALEACSDKDHGDVCSFENDFGDSIDGACGYQGGVEGKLICVPID
ncbi:MAG: hypothetical protein AB7I18_06285 [Candidatus Berkiella sp.]